MYNRRRPPKKGRIPLMKLLVFTLVIVCSLSLVVLAFFTPAWFKTIFIREITDMALHEPLICTNDIVKGHMCVSVIECNINYAIHLIGKSICGNLTHYDTLFKNKELFATLFRILTLIDSVYTVDLIIIKILFSCIIVIGISAPFPLIVLNLQSCYTNAEARNAKLITGCLLVVAVVLSLITLIISNHLQLNVDEKCFALNKEIADSVKELNKLCIIPDFWSQVFFSLGIFGFLFVGLVLLDRSELDAYSR